MDLDHPYIVQYSLHNCAWAYYLGGGGGASHLKETGMHVISLWGVNVGKIKVPSYCVD